MFSLKNLAREGLIQFYKQRVMILRRHTNKYFQCIILQSIVLSHFNLVKCVQFITQEIIIH